MNAQQVVEESLRDVIAATYLKLMFIIPFYLGTPEAKQNNVFTHHYLFVYIFSDLQFTFQHTL